METSKKTTFDKKPREKSALYPAVSIGACYDFIKEIDSLGGKAASYASILTKMGLTSPTTKSFLSRISASKQFGFITTGGSIAQLTDLARRILYPNKGDDESKRLLVEAFGNPPLYAKLIERFNDKAVPEKKQLSNILMNDYRIIKQVKDNAADCFIQSADYLGLLVNGILCMDASDDRQKAENYIKEDNADKSDSVNINMQRENTSSDSEEGYHFEIPTLGKKTARFYIPDGVTEKDIDYINLYIKNMFPAFLDNLKSEISKT